MKTHEIGGEKKENFENKGAKGENSYNQGKYRVEIL